MKVQVTNTGTLPWTPAGPTPFRLSYHWYRVGAVSPGTVPTTAAPNYGAVVFNGRRTFLPGPVGPNQTTTLPSATLQAPSNPGTYILKWDMVHENKAWFSWKGVPTGEQTVVVK